MENYFAFRYVHNWKWHEIVIEIRFPMFISLNISLFGRLFAVLESTIIDRFSALLSPCPIASES
jgi:hypothetical protein